MSAFSGRVPVNHKLIKTDNFNMPLFNYVPEATGVMQNYYRKKYAGQAIQVKGRRYVKASLTRRTRLTTHTFRRSSNAIFSINNTSTAQGFTFSAGTAQGLSITFGLGQNVFSNGLGTFTQTQIYTDLTNLYDQYKIKSIKLTFRHNYNTVQGDATTCVPIFVICTDYDDNGAPSVEDTVRLYDGHKEFQIPHSAPYTYNVRPKPVTEVLGSTGTALAAGVTKQEWLNCSSPLVPHYGIKLWMNTFGMSQNTTQLGYLSITTDMIVEMKNSR